MRRQFLRWAVGAAVLFASGLLFVGCEDEDTSEEITATRFYVDRDLASYDGNDVYDWDTTLSQARFEIRIKDFRAGDANVRVYDAKGKLLLNAALVTQDYTIYVGDNEFTRIGQTATGTPGLWKVQLGYNDFSGEQTITME